MLTRQLVLTRGSYHILLFRILTQNVYHYAVCCDFDGLFFVSNRPYEYTVLKYLLRFIIPLRRDAVSLEKCFRSSASRARFHDAETYVLTLKKSRVVDRGGRARRGTERVDGKRVDASLTCVPYWYFLSHDSSDGVLQQLCMTRVN